MKSVINVQNKMILNPSAKLHKKIVDKRGQMVVIPPFFLY